MSGVEVVADRGGERVTIAYESIDQCSADEGLRSLFNDGASGFIRHCGRRVTRDVSTFDDLVAQLKSNARIVGGGS